MTLPTYTCPYFDANEIVECNTVSIENIHINWCTWNFGIVSVCVLIGLRNRWQYFFIISAVQSFSIEPMIWRNVCEGWQIRKETKCSGDFLTFCNYLKKMRYFFFLSETAWIFLLRLELFGICNYYLNALIGCSWRVTIVYVRTNSCFLFCFVLNSAGYKKIKK